MDQTTVDLLLVDDEDDFRAAVATALGRRGFAVRQAASGQQALEAVAARRPQVVVLDVKMAGMNGIETLQQLRASDPHLPVLILTGHGTFHDALAGIKAEITDFMQKPVEVDELARHLRDLLAREAPLPPLREPTLAELMVAPDRYPRLYVDQSAEEVLTVLARFLVDHPGSGVEPEVRSALVFDRDEHFVGMVRFADLMKLALPRFLAEAPYPTFYPGMFLAQCKVISQRGFADLMARAVTVDVRAPLLAAVNLMVRHRLNALPVVDGEEVVGVLRDRAVILEIARHAAGVE